MPTLRVSLSLPESFRSRPLPGPPSVMSRNPTLDILRGALLILMTMTHLPTKWAGVLDQPFGFISAAEGFVFLSAFLAGTIYVSQREAGGHSTAVRWLLKRALHIYLLHAVLLVVAFTVVAWAAVRLNRPTVLNLLGFYFEQPNRAALSAAALIYQPPLLDILPMYVLFLLLTIPLMKAVERHGWPRVLGISVAIWTMAQFGLRRFVFETVDGWFGWNFPYSALGSFDLLAWQLLWVLGLWFGLVGVHRTRAAVNNGGAVLNVALALSLGLLVWRHVGGRPGFSDPAASLFWIDKWTLSPVRLLNLGALLCLLVSLRREIVQRLPTRLFALLGSSSLWVFFAHLLSILLILLAVDGDAPAEGATGIAVLLAGYLALFSAAIAHRRWRELRGGS